MVSLRQGHDSLCGPLGRELRQLRAASRGGARNRDEIRRDQNLSIRRIRCGRVLAAEFYSQKKTYRAVWFQDPWGRGGYYTPEGDNLRKVFLRSPLEFSRITSGFGMRRHPIFLQWRAHQGVDYGAPAGTRVKSTGEGVVSFAGRRNGYGNLIVLRHHGGYSTYYAHLRNFARGMRAGSRIVQGEIIGYVGQTGWASGPHLHYEFHLHNQNRNP